MVFVLVCLSLFVFHSPVTLSPPYSLMRALGDVPRCQICLKLMRTILIMWLECRFLDTEVDGSKPGICMLCP